MTVSDSSHNVDVSKGEVTSAESTETLISQSSIVMQKIASSTQSCTYSR